MYTKAVNILHTVNPLSNPSLKKLPSEMKHTSTSFPAIFTFRPINKRQFTNTSCINFMVKFFKHHSDASDSHFSLSVPPVLLVTQVCLKKVKPPPQRVRLKGGFMIIMVVSLFARQGLLE